MNNLRKMGINMLCRFGKFGVGKSLTLEMYDFEVPKELAEYNTRMEERQKTIRNKCKWKCNYNQLFLLVEKRTNVWTLYKKKYLVDY